MSTKEEIYMRLVTKEEGEKIPQKRKGKRKGTRKKKKSRKSYRTEYITVQKGDYIYMKNDGNLYYLTREELLKNYNRRSPDLVDPGETGFYIEKTITL